MVIHMKDILEKICFMGKVSISLVKKVIILAIGMKVNSKKGCLMDMVNILQIKVMCIKDNLKKISIMVLENIILKMVNYTKVIGNMGNTMA